MKNEIFVCGHKHPDTDSIVSSLAYSYLKNKLGFHTVPIRIGALNSETTYLLRKFNIQAPKLQFDIKTRVCDIEFDEALKVLPNETIINAWNMMREQDKKVVGVVDENDRLLGLTTISSITNALLASTLKNYELVKKIPLESIANTLNGKIIVNPSNYHPNGIIKITSNTSIETGKMAYQDVCVIASSRSTSHLYAIQHHASLLIVTQANDVEKEVLDEAIKNDCAIICTPFDLFLTAQNVCGAIPIKDIMNTNLISFSYYDYLDDVAAVLPNTRYRAYPIIDEKGILKGFISRYHLWNHEKRKIILVDHNEIAQSIDGILEADVIEIVDHHKVGDVQTNIPISFRNEIIGSCSSIITKMFKEYNIEIPRYLAGLLCGAIISDTLNFNSPTCTDVDIKLANELAELAEVDLHEFANELIRASSSLSGKGINEIINNDLKEFVMNSYRIVIGQINVIDPEYILEIKESLNEFMNGYCVTNHYDCFLMIFTDIKEKGSYLISAGKDHYLCEYAFDSNMINKNGLDFVPSLMSRKSQVVPALLKAVNSYNKN